MKGRKGAIFKAFRESYELKAIPDFDKHTTLYSGLPFAGDNLSQEELMGTPEYVGFVDGLEDRPPNPDYGIEDNSIATVRVFKRKGPKTHLEIDSYDIESGGAPSEKERYHDGFSRGAAKRGKV